MKNLETGKETEILADSPDPRPYQPEPQTTTLPPRPLEITWPDTRELSHCLGHEIVIRIQVGQQGEILSAMATDDDHPADCILAALESARQIVFSPATIDGVPASMWTEVRIDFRKRP